MSMCCTSTLYIAVAHKLEQADLCLPSDTTNHTKVKHIAALKRERASVISLPLTCIYKLCIFCFLWQCHWFRLPFSKSIWKSSHVGDLNGCSSLLIINGLTISIQLDVSRNTSYSVKWAVLLYWSLYYLYISWGWSGKTFEAVLVTSICMCYVICDILCILLLWNLPEKLSGIRQSDTADDSKNTLGGTNKSSIRSNKRSMKWKWKWKRQQIREKMRKATSAIAIFEFESR